MHGDRQISCLNWRDLDMVYFLSMAVDLWARDTLVLQQRKNHVG
jgi:hypothetical protein